jgi:hypothetical protein
VSPAETMIENHSDIDVVVEIPVLCRFWAEDGVWNGEAVDLPVAIFGETFELAQKHLFNAVISHLEALEEIGKLKETAERLRTCANQHCLSISDMRSNEPFVRFNAGIQDHRVFAIA